MSLTNDPSDPDLGHGPNDTPVNQNRKYLVLSDEERARGFVRPVRLAYRHRSCGSVTTMAVEIAETYARKPSFYSATYCCACMMHRPVNEFVWVDGDTMVGS